MNGIALVIAGILFGIVALMHLLRLFFRTQVTIGKKIIPMWVSILGFIIPLIMSILMFMMSGG